MEALIASKVDRVEFSKIISTKANVLHTKSHNSSTITVDDDTEQS
jgi:hypothetical protein